LCSTINVILRGAARHAYPAGSVTPSESRGQVPRRLAPTGHALAHSAYEKDRHNAAHGEIILNYFNARKQISSGTVEGLDNRAKLTI
jgi:hypothetical protein